MADQRDELARIAALLDERYQRCLDAIAEWGQVRQELGCFQDGLAQRSSFLLAKLDEQKARLKEKLAQLMA